MAFSQAPPTTPDPIVEALRICLNALVAAAVFSGVVSVLMLAGIRALAFGFVHQFVHHTIGGFIPGGQPIKLIVRGNDVLVIDVRVAPQEIDKVPVGQEAVVRFPSLPHGTTPELTGTMARLLSDMVHEPQTNSIYFLTRLAVHQSELDRLGRNRIVPGTPAEVYVKTGERTALAYLTKPLIDQINRAFREQ